MAGSVGVWFAKLGRETAPVATDAEVVVGGRAHQGDAMLEVESLKKGGVQVQERRIRRNSGVLSNSEATVCLLMDRFAPA